MAIRYSGDVEARVAVAGRGGSHVAVSLKWPEGGHVRRSTYVEKNRTGARPTTTGYDGIVRRALLDLLSIRPHLPVEKGSLGRLIVRRVFQAPCPR